MMDTIAHACSTHTWPILLMLLGAFLLGLLLGYLLWYGYRKMVAGLQKEANQWKSKHSDLEKEYASLKHQLEEQKKDNLALKDGFSNLESEKTVLQLRYERLTREHQDLSNQFALAASNAPTAAPAVEETVELEAQAAEIEVEEPPIITEDLAEATTDDATIEVSPLASSSPSGAAHPYLTVFKDTNLQIIEGVGPKIEGLLQKANYGTWGTVAAASADDLQKVLDDAGSHYKIHNPFSWPEQAQMAHAGDWDKLVEYQRFLDSGRENTGDGDTPSKVEKLYIKAVGFKDKPSDLKIVEGIGPKIESLLKENGIKNWSDLANSSVDQLKAILATAGSRYSLAVPDSWPQQATLAVERNWSALKALQDQLDGGVKK